MATYRILVVDDYPHAAQTIATLFGALGHETRFATHGEEAIAIARTFVPEIALVDLGLPDISGHEVAAKLRELVSPAPYLVAMTGLDGSDARLRLLAAGFDHYLLKPLDASIVKRVLTAVEARRTGVAHPRIPTSHSSRSR